MPFDELIDHPLDEIDVRLARRPYGGLGRPFDLSRVLAASDIAKGFLSLPSGRGEVDRWVWANGQLPRNAGRAIPERPRPRPRGLKDQIENADPAVWHLSALVRDRQFSNREIG